MKRALVLGATGFIGHHMARRLKSEGYYVVGVDIKKYEYGEIDFADGVIFGDLADQSFCKKVFGGKPFDEVYQFAALMGGCQFIFTGDHDADIMSNSAMVNLNVCSALKNTKSKIFFSSSACIYPEQIQDKIGSAALKEEMAWPLNPDSLYGIEKGFSERLYLSYARNYGMDIRIARFHNIYGHEGIYQGGKEKAPASISRKVAEATDKIQIWGDGKQERSFLFINDCIDAVRLLMESDYKEPINIGSEERVSINELWETAIKISGKWLEVEHIDRPPNTLGVVSRNSDNSLIKEKLGWSPKYSLQQGMEKTYKWIHERVKNYK